MWKNIYLLLFCAVNLILSACVSTNLTASTVRNGSAAQVHYAQVVKTKSFLAKKQLADGTIVKLGMLKPKATWNCQAIAKQNYNWNQLRLQGRFQNGNRGYGLIWSKIIEYANQNHLHTNYVYYQIPYVMPLFIARSESEYPGPENNVTVIYYNCRTMN